MRRGELVGLWVLLGLSFAAALLPPGTPGLVSLIAGWVPVAFAFWHFSRWVGVVWALTAFVVISAVSFTAEAVGVATGIVFGDYYYPDGPLGPLVLGVPPLILLQYFAMGYASLFLGRALAGLLRSPGGFWRTAAATILAAFALTVLDLATDPWQSTHLGDWIWRDGGEYFGVPIHNFLGWFAESLVFFAIVNAILAMRRPVARIARTRPPVFDLQGILLYGTFPFAVLVRPLLGSDDQSLAIALAGVAAFAVLPLLLAGVVAVVGRRR